MRIAFFHELPFGGARRAVSEYSRALRKLGNLCDLYYVDEVEDKETRAFFDNVYFYNFLPRKYSGNNWISRVYKDTVELIKLRSLHAKIAEEIDSKVYDLAFVHPSKFTQAPFILRFLRIKKIYYCEEPLRLVYDEFVREEIDKISLFKRYYEKTNRFVRMIIDKRNIDKADLILVNSLFSKEWVRKSYNKDAKVCRLGVDTEKFKPMRVKKEYDILFVGQKDRIEGWDLLEDSLKSFSKKPKIKVVQRAQSGKGIPDSELVKEYNRTKIVVCLSRNEPFGLVPLEAMACGVPIIAVNEGGYRETIVEGETGYLVNRNPNVIAEKMNSLLKNPALASKLGENGRRHVLKKWTWEKRIGDLESILLEAKK